MKKFRTLEWLIAVLLVALLPVTFLFNVLQIFLVRSVLQSWYYIGLCFPSTGRFSVPIFIVALFPFAVAAVWCGASWVTAKIAGWDRLARLFRAPGPPSGKCFRVQRGKVGMATYNGFLTIHSSHSGVYVSVWRLFCLGHPPLFIPWAAIHNTTTHRHIWSETVVFDVGSPSIVALELPKKVFEGQGFFV